MRVSRKLQSVSIKRAAGSEAELDPEVEFDVVLLRDYARGGREAFETLYRRHAPAVLRYALKLLAEKTAAEDVTQETFITLWRKRDGIRLIDESLLPWLLVTCRNLAHNHERAQARRPVVSLDDQLVSAAAPIAERELLFELLSGLTDVDRQVCSLCLVDGMSYREAARVLQTSETAVGKRLQRARQRIREAMRNV